MVKASKAITMLAPMGTAVGASIIRTQSLIACLLVNPLGLEGLISLLYDSPLRFKRLPIQLALIVHDLMIRQEDMCWQILLPGTGLVSM